MVPRDDPAIRRDGPPLEIDALDGRPYQKDLLP